LKDCNRFTFSQIKYLIWLYRLSQDGCGVKNIELANALDVSKPSVHYMLKSLSDLGLVRQEPFKLAHLTKEGRSLAQKYVFCFDVLERKISEIFGNENVSETAICGLLADMSLDKINDLYERKK